MTFALRAALAAHALAAATAVAPASPATLAFDWPSFPSRSDPVWSWGGPNATSVQPVEWVQSLFGGNGDLGFMLWQPQNSANGELQMHVSRQTLWDDRTPDLGPIYYLDNFALDQPRLPLGYFSITMTSGAPLLSATGRVSLWDAVAQLNVTTPAGSCALAAWASAAHDRAAGGADVVVLETSWAGSEACVVKWVPLRCASTWSNDARYVFNPPPLNATAVLSPELELTTVSQPHLPQKGTWHSTAVLRSQLHPTAAAYVVTVSPVLGSQAAADAWAAAEVGAAVAAGGLPALRAAHEADWHSWWPAGGALTFEYSLLESFWYLQLFKFRSGARPGIVHDLEGPWFIECVRAPALCV